MSLEREQLLTGVALEEMAPRISRSWALPAQTGFTGVFPSTALVTAPGNVWVSLLTKKTNMAPTLAVDQWGIHIHPLTAFRVLHQSLVSISLVYSVFPPSEWWFSSLRIICE